MVPRSHETMVTRWWQLKYFLCSPLPGEDEPILTIIFVRWVETTNQVIVINHAPTDWGDLCKNFITAGVRGVGSKCKHEIEIEVAWGLPGLECVAELI